MIEVILDALFDSLKALPFIFLIYILMEVLESVKNREKIEKALSGSYAPVIASFTGIVPECGFSVMCAKLFDKGLIKIGTLISAFIATSDEGLIILISDGVIGSKTVSVKEVALILLIKIVYAIIIGGIINVIFKKLDNKHTCSNHGECIECGDEEGGFIHRFILHPLFHAIKIFAYLFIINVVFGIIMYFAEEEFTLFINQNLYLQPVVSSIIGLIPNCASSTIIATAYTSGYLSMGGLVAGLSTNCGMGIILLFKNKKDWKAGAMILLTTFIAGIIIGYITILLFG